MNIILDELYNLLNNNLGFIFDFKILNVPDFYQFTIYYCSNILNVQYISGIFIAFPKFKSYYRQLP
jgi:hypothetical protein